MQRRAVVYAGGGADLEGRGGENSRTTIAAAAITRRTRMWQQGQVAMVMMTG